MRRRPSIDAVLDRPEVRAELDEFKRLYAVAEGLLHSEDPSGYGLAAFAASAAALRIVEEVRADPRNSGLPERPVYHYVIDTAFHDLASPIMPLEERRQAELTVYFPPGRRAGRRSEGRQKVIDEIRRNPDLTDSQIAYRAWKHGAWKLGQAEEPANRKRRITRLRRDAANQ